MKKEEQPHVEVAKPHLLVHGMGENLKHVVATSLDEAKAYAEFLANEQGDDTTRIFEMRELDISFKTYYQVHVTGEQETPLPPPDEPATVIVSDELERKVVPISA